MRKRWKILEEINECLKESQETNKQTYEGNCWRPDLEIKTIKKAQMSGNLEIKKSK